MTVVMQKNTNNDVPLSLTTGATPVCSGRKEIFLNRMIEKEDDK